MQHNKMSPMLREMLADVVDLDNDVSILKRMEQIVNDYKARVEGILQTADDDEVGGAGDADGVAATAAAAAAAGGAGAAAARRRGARGGGGGGGRGPARPGDAATSLARRPKFRCRFPSSANTASRFDSRKCASII